MPDRIAKTEKEKVIQTYNRIGLYAKGTRKQKALRVAFLDRFRDLWPELGPDGDPSSVPARTARKLEVKSQEQDALIDCYLDIAADPTTATTHLQAMYEEADMLRIGKRFRHLMDEGEAKVYEGEEDEEPQEEDEEAEAKP